MIQINPLTNDIKTLKSAIEKIAREAQSQTPVQGQEDRIYVDSAPAVENLKEGAFVPYLNAGVYRIYTRINGVLKYWTLT